MPKDFSDIFELIRNKIHQLPFCNHKKIDLPFDSIEVEGIGKISIPISLNEIERLKTRATQAPFGRGFKTLVDREVRDVLQIDGAQLLLQENVLAETIKDLLGEMNIDVDAIGVEGKLYKLLVYEEHGHFVKHRDTEKEKGMFGTLLLQLPVEGGYEGGSLVVSHEGEEKEVVFDKESEKQAYAVAFYADCEHELKGVKRGYRVALAVNLVWKKLSQKPYSMMIEKKSLPYVMSALSEMEGYLKEWKERVKDNAEESVFHAMPLAHKYTEQNLSFMGLKGRDSELARFFLSVEGLEVFLVLEEKYENGGGDEEDSYDEWRRHYGEEEDENDEDEDEDEESDEEETSENENSTKPNSTSPSPAQPTEKNSPENKDENDSLSSSSDGDEGVKEMTCLVDRKFKTTEWIDRYDDSHPFDDTLKLDLDYDLVGVSIDNLFRERPTEQEYEYTGNEGLQLENWYHAALLVISPKEAFFRHLFKEDPSKAIAFLLSRLEILRKETNTSGESEEVFEEKKQDLFNLMKNALRSQETDLIQSFKSIESLCNDFDYPEGLRDLFRGMKSLPNRESVGCYLKMLDLVGQEEWLHHIQSVVFENSQKAESLPIFCSLILQLIEKGHYDEPARVLGALFASFVLPQKVLIKWTTEDLLGFLKILFFLEDRNYLITFAYLLMNEGNELKEDAALHRLLGSPDLMTSFVNSNLSSKQKKRPVTEIEEERQEDENDCKKEWLDLVVKARLAKINELQPPPMNTWSFPEANTGHAELDAFLRSEQRTKVFRGFSRLDDARKFDERYLSSRYRSYLSAPIKFSATRNASGRGRDSILTVEKNRSYYQNQNKFYEKMRKYADDLNRKVKIIYGEAQSINNVMKEEKSVNNPKKKKKISNLTPLAATIDLTSL